MKLRIQVMITDSVVIQLTELAQKHFKGNISKASEYLIKKAFGVKEYSSMSDLDLYDEMQNIKDELEKRKPKELV